MKKLFFLACLACSMTMAFVTKSSAQVFEKGNSLIGVQVGLLSTFQSSGLSSSLPPLSLTYEYGVTDKISVGGFFGYSTASQTLFGTDEIKYNYTLFGARGSYHFLPDNEKFDWYVGGLLGYNKVSVSMSTSDPATVLLSSSASASAVLFGVYAGGKYYITENIGLQAELGYGVAVANLGLAIKF